MKQYIQAALFLVGTLSSPSLYAEDTARKVEAILPDRNYNNYELQSSYELHHGMAYYGYYLVSDTKKEKELVVFEGKTFGDSESCPSVYDQNFILEKAITEHTCNIKDINKDGFKDMELHFTELICNTGKHIYHNKLLIASDKGFTLKETIREEH